MARWPALANSDVSWAGPATAKWGDPHEGRSARNLFLPSRAHPGRLIDGPPANVGGVYWQLMSFICCLVSEMIVLMSSFV